MPSGVLRAHGEFPAGVEVNDTNDTTITAGAQSVCGLNDPPPDAAKRFATLQAQLALGGFVLRRVAAGFIVTRWNLARDLATLDDVARFANLVRAQK